MTYPSASMPTDLQFIPVPLASGDTLTSDRATRSVVAMSVTIHLEDGGVHNVPLEQRDGGWWAPTDPAGI